MMNFTITNIHITNCKIDIRKVFFCQNFNTDNTQAARKFTFQKNLGSEFGTDISHFFYKHLCTNTEQLHNL